MIRGVALLLTLLTLVPSARADEPKRVALALHGEWDDPTRVGVRADLAANVRHEGFELVHMADGAAGILATVHVDAPAADRVTIRIVDDVTGKEVKREVALSGVPRDTWPVVIATSADELLRASWAELTLDHAPEAPAVVAATLERHLTPERVTERAPPARWRLLARGGGEGYTGGDIHLGGDLVFQLRLGESRLSLELAAGGRRAPSRRSERGDVWSVSAGGEAGLAIELLRAHRTVHLDLALGLRTAWVGYRAEANEGSSATDGSGLLVSTKLSLRWGLSLGPLLLMVDLGIGAPIAGVEARDDSSAITGATGLGFHGGLMVGWER